MPVSDPREQLEAAIREETARAWRRCAAYSAAGQGIPLADPESDAVVRRVLHAADRYSASEITAATGILRDAAEARQRLAAAAAEAAAGPRLTPEEIHRMAGGTDA